MERQISTLDRDIASSSYRVLHGLNVTMYFILFTVILAFAVLQISMYLYVYEPDYVYELVKNYSMWPWIQMRHPRIAKNLERHNHREEECPFNNTTVYTKKFDHRGDRLTIEDYAVTLIVPRGAIAPSINITIRVACSLFGPFTIPTGYHCISAYVWIQVHHYDFQKPLKVILEHHASTADISNLCVLKTVSGDGHAEMRQVPKHEYQFKINSRFCTYQSDYFCSLCLAAKDEYATNIISYHFLPKNYQSMRNFEAEVCFCYDLKPCKQRIMQARKLQTEYVLMQCPKKFSLCDQDKIFLSDPIINVGMDDWDCGVKEQGKPLTRKQIDFRMLNYDEYFQNVNTFPPRFVVQFTCINETALKVEYSLSLFQKFRKSIFDQLFSNLGKPQCVPKKLHEFKVNVECIQNSLTDRRCEAAIVEISSAMEMALMSSTEAYRLSRYDEFIEQKPEILIIKEVVVPRIDPSYWQDLCLLLGLGESVITGINALAKDDLNKCCEILFDKWLKDAREDCVPKTWYTLICCINDVDPSAAEAIREELKNETE